MKIISVLAGGVCSED